jgi:hypothetical protein
VVLFFLILIGTDRPGSKDELEIVAGLDHQNSSKQILSLQSSGSVLVHHPNPHFGRDLAGVVDTNTGAALVSFDIGQTTDEPVDIVFL